VDRARERAQAKSRGKPATAESPAQAFHHHRQMQAQRARILGMLLIPVEPGFVVPLRRAPDVQAACQEAYGGLAGSPLPSRCASCRV
jgi:hypothetical protein